MSGDQPRPVTTRLGPINVPAAVADRLDALEQASTQVANELQVWNSNGDPRPASWAERRIRILRSAVALAEDSQHGTRHPLPPTKDSMVLDLFTACAPFADAPDYGTLPDDAIVLRGNSDGLFLTAGQVRAIKAAMGKAGATT